MIFFSLFHKSDFYVVRSATLLTTMEFHWPVYRYWLVSACYIKTCGIKLLTIHWYGTTHFFFCSAFCYRKQLAITIANLCANLWVMCDLVLLFQCARQGFALGLTILLYKIPSIKVQSFLKLIVDLLEVSSSMKGQVGDNSFIFWSMLWPVHEFPSENL